MNRDAPDYPANLSLGDLLVCVANTHHNPNIFQKLLL